MRRNPEDLLFIHKLVSRAIGRCIFNACESIEGVSTKVGRFYFNDNLWLIELEGDVLDPEFGDEDRYGLYLWLTRFGHLWQEDLENHVKKNLQPQSSGYARRAIDILSKIPSSTLTKKKRI